MGIVLEAQGGIIRFVGICDCKRMCAYLIPIYRDHEGKGHHVSVPLPLVDRNLGHRHSLSRMNLPSTLGVKRVRSRKNELVHRHELRHYSMSKPGALGLLTVQFTRNHCGMFYCTLEWLH